MPLLLCMDEKLRQVKIIQSIFVLLILQYFFRISYLMMPLMLEFGFLRLCNLVFLHQLRTLMVNIFIWLMIPFVDWILHLFCLNPYLLLYSSLDRQRYYVLAIRHISELIYQTLIIFGTTDLPCQR